MKKIYFMGLTAAFAMSVNAQTTIKINRSSLKGEIKNSSSAKVASPNAIAASIACPTQYTAGTTQNLNLTLNLSNTDNEYGDSLSITLPTGFTLNTAFPNDSIGVSEQPTIAGSGCATTAGGTKEPFRGIFGQNVVWGNNDNCYGGMPSGANAGSTMTITLNVTVGSLVAGPQTFNFFVSGDGFGGATAANFNGTFIIYPAGAAIVDMKTKLVVPTTITAINNCSLGMSPIFARFINLSSSAQSNFPVNYSVNGAASTTTIIAGPLAVGDSVNVTFATPFNFTPSNMYTVKAWVSQPTDVTMTNDTASLEISNTFPTTLTNTITPYINGIESAYDFGSINKVWAGSGAPFGQSFATFHTGVSALYYTIAGNAPPATYETFAILPCVDVTSSEIYKISYWRKANTSSSLTVNGQTEVLTGTGQAIASMTTVVKAYSAITPGAWSKDSTYFTATANETRYFAIAGKGTITAASDQINVRIDDIMITKMGTVGIKTNSLNDAISIFPNPTSGVLNINSVEVVSSIEVFNVIGEKVYTNSLVKGNNTVDLSGLTNGAYFVKMNSNNQVITKKIILSK